MIARFTAMSCEIASTVRRARRQMSWSRSIDNGWRMSTHNRIAAAGMGISHAANAGITLLAFVLSIAAAISLTRSRSPHPDEESAELAARRTRAAGQ
jgi:hypothetical protein